MAPKPTYYTVATSFFGALNGDGIEYHKGEVVAADDPALERWPEHFVPLVVREHLRLRPIEQATAGPGEVRGHAITTDDFRPKARI